MAAGVFLSASCPSVPRTLLTHRDQSGKIGACAMRVGKTTALEAETRPDPARTRESRTCKMSLDPALVLDAAPPSRGPSSRRDLGGSLQSNAGKILWVRIVSGRSNAMLL